MRLTYLAVLLATTFLVSETALAKKRSKSRRQPAESGASASVDNDRSALERVYRFQDLRIADPYLKSALYNSSPRVVRAAILAMGRIGDPIYVEDLAGLMNKKNREYQKLAAFSLGLIGGDVAFTILEQQSQFQKDADFRAVLLKAIALVGKEAGVKAISKAILTESHPTLLEGATQALGILWSGDSQGWELPEGLLAKLIALSKQPGAQHLPASFALSRYKGDLAKVPLNDLLSASIAAPSPNARALLFRALSKHKNGQVNAFFSNVVNSKAATLLRIEAVKALAVQTPNEISVAALKQVLSEKNSPLVVAALDTLATYGSEAASAHPQIEAVFKTSGSWVQASALKALARVQPEKTRAILSGTLPPLPEGTVLQAYALMGTPADIKAMIPLLADASNRAVVAALEPMMQLPSGAFTSELKDVLRRLYFRKDVGIVSEASALVEKHGWKDFIAVMMEVYGSFTAPDAVEAKVAILNCFATVWDISVLTTVEEALKDNEKVVVVAAAKAYKAILGKESKVPLNSKVTAEPPTVSEAQASVGVTVVLQTQRGEIRMKLLPEAPITSAYFLRLVRSKFYDGKTFHRVVPNFVVQGGDPRGDGFGGPGYLIRDEVSPRQHWTGTVGIATAGKDTGGCQFFFNLAPNLHLDGRYTIFAEVTEGMDVIERLEIGDRILSARVK